MREAWLRRADSSYGARLTQGGRDGEGSSGVERWLEAHPTCSECARRGLVTAATDLDHLVPLSAGWADDEGNYESKGHECHSAKTVREDGGLGHASGDSR